jgi:hypothetical protein
MKKIALNLPMFGFVVATRAMLGAGAALLLSPKLSDAQRRALGVTLVSLGATATVPAVLAIMRGRREAQEAYGLLPRP